MQKKWQFLFSLAFGAIWMLCLYFTFDATLSLTQLHLSDGVTAYSPLVGSLVLTGLLLLLQRLVQRFTRFRQSCFFAHFFSFNSSPCAAHFLCLRCILVCRHSHVRACICLVCDGCHGIVSS